MVLINDGIHHHQKTLIELDVPAGPCLAFEPNHQNLVHFLLLPWLYNLLVLTLDQEYIHQNNSSC